MKKDTYLPLRHKLEAQKASGGPRFWRSTEEKRGEVDATEEIPSGTAPLTDLQRRDVLKIAGATFALAGAAGCIRRPEEEILPYTHQPEAIIPGLPTFYASAQPRSGGALGVLVETHEGRPTKIEGNAQHPSSLGASDVWAQSEVLKLYDPDRARSPLSAGKAVSFGDWDTFSKSHFAKYAGNGGTGLAFLFEQDEAPTLERLLGIALGKLPNARVYKYDPLFPAQADAGAALAFGAGARVHHDLSKAKAVLALDADFLVEGPDHLRHAKQWAQGRKFKTSADAKATMNRLYVVEGVHTSTGATADHRLRLSSAQGKAFLLGVVGELAKLGVTIAGVSGGAAPAGSDKIVGAVAKDLAAGGVVLVGERQPAAVHALGYAINVAVGGLQNGALVVTAPAVQGSAPGSLADLKKALDDKAVETLVVFDGNPAFTAPGAFAMKESLKKAQTVVHFGVVPDETAQSATWHVPMAHFLESWDDTRAWDGTASVVQPMILPLFGARSRVSLLAQVTGYEKTEDKALVEETWSALGPKGWRKALHDGVIAGTARAANPAAAANGASIAGALGADIAAPSKDAVEVAFEFGPVLDGRLGNVPWNQELPHSMSKLCWDNALLVSPALAKEMGIESAVYKNRYKSDVVKLTVNGVSVEVPTFVLPGLGQYTTSITRGYGKSSGEVATGVGVDVGAIVPADGSVAYGVKLEKTGKTVDLCSTQDHFFVPDPMNELTFAQMSKAQGEDRVMKQGNRNLYRKTTLKLYEETPQFAHEGDIPANLVAPGGQKHQPKKGLQTVDEFTYDKQQWGMVIDLGACTGCNACTVACQAENNIPAVGRHQVMLGREMHWIRIDRYFSGDVDDAEAVHQPIACMHCENAPCEPVCPVSATVHDEEGINSMAYNRCIGTRYCANNCPYKVRRFNYLDFTVTGNVYRDAHQAKRHDVLKHQRNPNVTVRYRGVMEKCTFCTQRVEEAKIAAKRAGQDRKALPDGAVVPACAQACPTDAIVFGNINDSTSRVHQLKLSERSYEMLEDLNVRPRTSFLARVKNTNSEVG